MTGDLDGEHDGELLGARLREAELLGVSDGASLGDKLGSTLGRLEGEVLEATLGESRLSDNDLLDSR